MTPREIDWHGVKVIAHEEGVIERLPPSKSNGKICGYKNGSGYLLVSVGGKPYPIHRLIAKAFLLDFSEDMQVDHANGDKTDNRAENLRMVSTRENSCGFQKKRKSATSRFRGVCFDPKRKRWCAQTTVYGRGIGLGRYKSEEAAAIARDRGIEGLGFRRAAFNLTNHPELSMLAGC